MYKFKLSQNNYLKVFANKENIIKWLSIEQGYYLNPRQVKNFTESLMTKKQNQKK
jgi:hypothetical protein